MKISSLMNQRSLILWFLFNDINRIFKQVVDQEMRSLGLTRPQWYLLSTIYFYEGSTQQELADLMDVGKSTVAKLIPVLEKEGWVSRNADEVDSRANRVYLSDQMKSTIKNLTLMAGATFENTLDCMSEKELDRLIASLKKIEARLEQGGLGNTKKIIKLKKAISRSLS